MCVYVSTRAWSFCLVASPPCYINNPITSTVLLHLSRVFCQTSQSSWKYHRGELQRFRSKCKRRRRSECSDLNGRSLIGGGGDLLVKRDFTLPQLYRDLSALNCQSLDKPTRIPFRSADTWREINMKLNPIHFFLRIWTEDAC